MSTELHRIAASRLQADAQRYTSNRSKLVDVLATAGQPVTIPEILAQQPGLAQSSVYRNLSVLERAGVVARIVTSDEWARYELAEDLTDHHHHLICSSCGAVSDFTLSAQVEQSIDAAFVRVAKRAGFRLEHHRLDLVGLCESCARYPRP
jgi:Fur family transcriptional regulator, ferric uptake regulator